MKILFVFTTQFRNCSKLMKLHKEINNPCVMFKMAFLYRDEARSDKGTAYKMVGINEGIKWADLIIVANKKVRKSLIKQDYYLLNNPKVACLDLEQSSVVYCKAVKNLLQACGNLNKVIYKVYNPFLKKVIPVEKLEFNIYGAAFSGGVYTDIANAMEYTGITDINGKDYYTGMGGEHKEYGRYIIKKGNYEHENMLLSGYYLKWMDEKANTLNLRPDIRFWITKRLDDMSFDKNIYENPELVIEASEIELYSAS